MIFEERGAAPHPAGGGGSRPLPRTPPGAGASPLDPEECSGNAADNSPLGSNSRRRFRPRG